MGQKQNIFILYYPDSYLRNSIATESVIYVSQKTRNTEKFAEINLNPDKCWTWFSSKQIAQKGGKNLNGRVHCPT